MMPARPPTAAVDSSRRRVIVALAAGASLGACSRLKFLAANLPARFGDYQRRADLRYGPHERNRLDVYLPVQPKSPAVVVFWHGGRWRFGDKGDYRFVGSTLAGAGYTTVIPNYRLYPQVKLAGFMEDAARAAEWVRAHAMDWQADGGRITFMGHSAGAHIAVMLGVNLTYLHALNSPLRPSGIIGLSGPYDFLPIKEKDLQELFGPPNDYPASQPVRFVTASAPPALLIYGGKDRIVNPRNSERLAAALEAVGVPVTLKKYPDLGHADTVAALSVPARGRAPILEDIERFLDQEGAVRASS